MMVYDISTELNLNRAVESIKLAQQSHKRELEKKDEAILSLRKSIEVMQYEVRDMTEAKRTSDKENRELNNVNSCLNHQLSIEQMETERLREEVNRLRQDLTNQEDKIAHLENEQEKANHIIRNLLKRARIK